MPTRNSIAIGCQWLHKEDLFLFLTNHDSHLYVIRAKKGFENTVTLDNRDMIVVPHGLGNVSLIGDDILYNSRSITVGSKEIDISGHLEFDKDIAVRKFATMSNGDSTTLALDKILSKCPGELVNTMHQIYNYNRVGTKGGGELKMSGANGGSLRD